MAPCKRDGVSSAANLADVSAANTADAVAALDKKVEALLRKAQNSTTSQGVLRDPDIPSDGHLGPGAIEAEVAAASAAVNAAVADAAAGTRAGTVAPPLACSATDIAEAGFSVVGSQVHLGLTSNRDIPAGWLTGLEDADLDLDSTHPLCRPGATLQVPCSMHRESAVEQLVIEIEVLKRRCHSEIAEINNDCQASRSVNQDYGSHQDQIPKSHVLISAAASVSGDGAAILDYEVAQSRDDKVHEVDEACSARAQLDILADQAVKLCDFQGQELLQLQKELSSRDAWIDELEFAGKETRELLLALSLRIHELHDLQQGTRENAETCIDSYDSADDVMDVAIAALAVEFDMAADEKPSSDAQELAVVRAERDTMHSELQELSLQLRQCGHSTVSSLVALSLTERRRAQLEIIELREELDAAHIATNIELQAARGAREDKDEGFVLHKAEAEQVLWETLQVQDELAAQCQATSGCISATAEAVQTHCQEEAAQAHRDLFQLREELEAAICENNRKDELIASSRAWVAEVAAMAAAANKSESKADIVTRVHSAPLFRRISSITRNSTSQAEQVLSATREVPRSVSPTPTPRVATNQQSYPLCLAMLSPEIVQTSLVSCQSPSHQLQVCYSSSRLATPVRDRLISPCSTSPPPTQSSWRAFSPCQACPNPIPPQTSLRQFNSPRMSSPCHAPVPGQGAPCSTYYSGSSPPRCLPLLKLSTAAAMPLTPRACAISSRESSPQRTTGECGALPSFTKACSTAYGVPLLKGSSAVRLAVPHSPRQMTTERQVSQLLSPRLLTPRPRSPTRASQNSPRLSSREVGGSVGLYGKQQLPGTSFDGNVTLCASRTSLTSGAQVATSNLLSKCVMRPMSTQCQRRRSSTFQAGSVSVAPGAVPAKEAGLASELTEKDYSFSANVAHASELVAAPVSRAVSPPLLRGRALPPR